MIDDALYILSVVFGALLLLAVMLSIIFFLVVVEALMS
jgi:hypothetical protein